LEIQLANSTRKLVPVMQNIELEPAKSQVRKQQIAARMQERQKQSDLRKGDERGPQLSAADSFLQQFQQAKQGINIFNTYHPCRLTKFRY